MGAWHHGRNRAATDIGKNEDKHWPILDQLAAAGPGNNNTIKKARHALRQIDRMLDVFEPGQIALSFNGGKDSTVMMHLVKAACDQHPTHSFTHVQPIWFQNPTHEFEELKDYVRAVSAEHFTYGDGLKTVTGENLNRLWTVHITTPRDFIDAMYHLSASTSIRCILMGSRRTDPGCRDLSSIELMDLQPIFLGSTLTRMKLETKLKMLKLEGELSQDSHDGNSRSIKEPSLMRISPILEWSYRDIWDFLTNVPNITYCSLYDQGYSSIGTMIDTVRNPGLLRDRVEKQLQEAQTLPDYTPERVTASRYEELTRENIATYKRLGADLYEYEWFESGPARSAEKGGKAKRSLAQLREASPMYYPAYLLTDESREAGSRVKVSGHGNIISADGRRNSTMEETAAILVIGDEVVSGLVQEGGSHSLMAELRKHGIQTKQVMKIENDIDVIAFMVRRLSPIYKYLFIFGGIGAGHDDVSMAAVAKAFGTGLQRNHRLLKLIVSCIEDKNLTALHLKMADFPYGSEIVGTLPEGADTGRNWNQLLDAWPVIKKNNCYITSSRPGSTQNLLDDLYGRLPAVPFFKSTIVVGVHHALLSREIAAASAQHAGVSVETFEVSAEEAGVTPEQAAQLAEDQTQGEGGEVHYTIMQIASKNWSQHHQVVATFLGGMDEESVLTVHEEKVEGTQGLEGGATRAAAGATKPAVRQANVPY